MIITKYGKFKVTNILRKVQYNNIIVISLLKKSNLSNGSVGLSKNSLIFARIVHSVGWNWWLLLRKRACLLQSWQTLWFILWQLDDLQQAIDHQSYVCTKLFVALSIYYILKQPLNTRLMYYRCPVVTPLTLLVYYRLWKTKL